MLKKHLVHTPRGLQQDRELIELANRASYPDAITQEYRDRLTQISGQERGL